MPFVPATPGSAPPWREALALGATAQLERAGITHGPERQSQTWVRIAEDWRIVSAHISMLGEGH